MKKRNSRFFEFKVYLGIFLFLVGLVFYANAMTSDFSVKAAENFTSGEWGVISGYAEVDASVIVNEQKVAISPVGEFSTRVPLKVGENSFIVHYSRGKNKSSRIISIERLRSSVLK